MNKNEQIQVAILNIRKQGSERVHAHEQAQRRRREQQRARHQLDASFRGVLTRNIPLMIVCALLSAWWFYSGLLCVEARPRPYSLEVITGAAFYIASFCIAVLMVLKLALEYLDLNPTVLAEPQPEAVTE